MFVIVKVISSNESHAFSYEMLLVNLREKALIDPPGWGFYQFNCPTGMGVYQHSQILNPSGVEGRKRGRDFQ